MPPHPDYAIFEGPMALDLSDPAQARVAADALLAQLTPASPDDPTLIVEDALAPGAPGGFPLNIRVYRREGRVQPVLLWLHGGGWIIGGIETDDFHCRHFARASGCAVVSLDYRLIPENPFPAAVEDVHATLTWLAANGLPSIDGGQLAVGGTSAGGNLAVVAGLVARDRGGPPLRLVLANSPLLDYRLNTPSMVASDEWSVMGRPIIRDLLDRYLAGAAATAYHAPARAESLADYPPLFMTMGAVEPMLDEAWAFTRRLLDAGSRAELHIVPGAPHGYERIGSSAATARAVALQAGALREALA